MSRVSFISSTCYVMISVTRLGLTWHSSFLWDCHCLPKAYRKFVMLYRMLTNPCTSLCRPMLEYAEAVWDPLTKSKIRDIEQIQNNAFIHNLKGHTDTVSEARNQRPLQSLQDRWKNHRLCLLAQILQNEYHYTTTYRQSTNKIVTGMLTVWLKASDWKPFVITSVFTVPSKSALGYGLDKWWLYVSL